ncbi:hypothetical protein SteCoe_27089 [Stentor coeruleus]|uniref:Uncharacterized protein n=1 Tax=Stentor coeruleus TaxID=5963 RepID=A0A1R2BBT7_9CILI|nr:hypothetical protein SteCoe_27089 [Stentor coeruleus]
MFDIKKCSYCSFEAAYRCDCNSDNLCNNHITSHLHIQKAHNVYAIPIWMSEKTKSYLSLEIIQRINFLKNIQDYLILATSEAIQKIEVASTKLIKELEGLKNYYRNKLSKPEFTQEDCKEIEIILKSTLHCSETNFEIPADYFAKFNLSIISAEHKDMETIKKIENLQRKPIFEVSCTPIGQNICSLVKCVALSRNCEFAVSGSSEKIIRIWDIKQNIQSNILTGHSYGILCVGITNNMKIIISGSEDKSIKLWNAGDKKMIESLHGHRDKVNSLAIFPDDSKFVSGSADFNIILWDLKNKKSIRSFKGHNGSVLSVSVTSNSEDIISCSSDKKIFIWDVSTGNAKRTLLSHTLAVCKLATSKDSLILASISLDKTIKIWDLENDQEIKSIEDSDLTPCAIEFFSLRSSFVVGYENGKAVVYDGETGEIQGILNGNNRKINDIVVSSDCKIIVAATDDGLKMWDIISDNNSEELNIL